MGFNGMPREEIVKEPRIGESKCEVDESREPKGKALSALVWGGSHGIPPFLGEKAKESRVEATHEPLGAVMVTRAAGLLPRGAGRGKSLIGFDFGAHGVSPKLQLIAKEGDYLPPF